MLPPKNFESLIGKPNMKFCVTSVSASQPMKTGVDLVSHCPVNSQGSGATVFVITV